MDGPPPNPFLSGAPSGGSAPTTPVVTDTMPGAPSNRIRVHLAVEGMMCQKNCGSTVQQALLKIIEGTTASTPGIQMMEPKRTCTRRENTVLKSQPRAMAAQGA